MDTFSTLNNTRPTTTGDISFYVTLKYTPTPSPTITWLHDGLPINTSESRVQLHEDSLSLHLTQLAVSDSGSYTVFMNNTVGSEKVVFFLDVEGMENSNPPFPTCMLMCMRACPPASWPDCMSACVRACVTVCLSACLLAHPFLLVSTFAYSFSLVCLCHAQCPQRSAHSQLWT